MLRYKSEVRVIEELDYKPQYHLEVEEGGEFTSKERPFMVWQVDLDDRGKAWNATPCIGFATLLEAVTYVNSKQEQQS